MNELFAWVPWFKELAQKIADGGPEYLARHAREIPGTHRANQRSCDTETRTP